MKKIFTFLFALVCAMSASARIIYLVPNEWRSDNASLFVHSWGSGSDIAGKMTKEADNLYKFDIGNNTNCLFVRQSPDLGDNINWDQKWNQTADLAIPSDKNCYTITGWGPNDGTWSTQGSVTPPTPDPNAAYYVTGSEELIGKELAWKADAIKMTKNADNTFSYTFADLPTDVAYRMKITNGTWDTNWGYSAVQNPPAGVAGDTDGNVVFKLATKGNVEVVFNGANITLKGNFTTEGPIKSSVPSECEDVMLQAFYYDSYQDGAPGDVVINGKQLGHTKWSVLLNQSGEIGSYFDLVWLPPSGKSEGGTGYHQTQYSNQNSAWGSQKELLEFINRMHAANTKVVADIVINHAGTKSSWCDFYTQYFGEYGTYEPDASWIAQSDEVNFNSEAGDCKGAATGPEDGGYNGQDNYGSARDWAHAKPEVQEMMKAYLKWMKNVIGFDGWRYDYAQGFKGKYIDMYNSASENYFSVVEFWNNDVSGYLVDANWNTLAFDFGTKYSAIQGIADGKFEQCKGSGLLGAGLSKYAVTFVDSHDTYFGCKNGRDNHDEIGGCGNSMEDYNKDRVLGANAFILSMPGVPCVFYPHWAKYKDAIGKMVLARKAAGVHSESKVSDEAGNGYYKSTITGKHGEIRLLLGPNSGFNTTPQGYTLAYKGGNFAMYYKTTQTEVPVLSITPSAIYKTESHTVEMSAVALSGKPTIYYTLDGSDPTISATKKTYNSAFAIIGTVTVKAYAELNGVKSAVQEATYTYQEPQKTPLTVKFMPPTSWEKVYLYAWDGASLGAWPGMEWKTKDSEGWLYHVFAGDVSEVKIIFSNGNGEQTNDIILDQDACYEWQGMEVLSQNCSLSDIPFQVIANPEGKIYKTEDLSITLSTIGEKSPATIYYTLDNSDPKTSSAKQTYSAPFTITGTKTLKAYAVADGLETEVVTHTYTYQEPQKTPLTVRFMPPASWTTVNLYAWDMNGTPLLGSWPGMGWTTKDSEGWLYYMFDAGISEVNIIFNNGSGVQSSDILLDQDACYTWDEETGAAVLSNECGVLEVDFQLLVSPQSMVYKTDSLSIEMQTIGNEDPSTIYYTLDNSDPKTSSTKQTYSVPIVISGTKTLKAYAVSGDLETDVVTHTYTYQKPQKTALVVKFFPPASWTTVNLYAWDMNSTPLLGEWPGMEWTTKDENDWLYHTFDEGLTEVNVIFNNGEGTQSQDIKVDEDICYIWNEDKQKAEIDPDCSGSDVENITTESIPMLNTDLPMYNMLGQQVDASYQGIIIQNGYKYILN